MQRSVFGAGFEGLILHCPKAHEGFHLVHVTPYRLGHLPRQYPVGVQRVVAQRRLMLQPP